MDRLPPAPAGTGPFLSCEGAVLRLRDGTLSLPLSWQMAGREQWAVLGPDSAGQEALLRAIAGRARLAAGRIVHHTNGAGGPIALVELQPGGEAGFYQARWNSPAADSTAPRVADVLAGAGRGAGYPFQVVEAPPDPGPFLARTAQVAALLGIEPLLRREPVHLSSGERRKVAIARALLSAPRLLLLEQPCAGLDAGSRARLLALLDALMAGGTRLLLTATRWADLPAGISHVLWLEGGRVLAAGPRHEVQACFPEAAGPPAGRDPARPTAAAEVLVHMAGVRVSYGGVAVLHDVDWTVRRGEHWALLGPNGAGKTTLLSLILADNPQAYANRVTLFGRRRGSGESIWDIKSRIGWLAPEQEAYLPGGMSCLDVVCSGFFDSAGLYRRASAAQQAAARAWLDRLGLLPQQHLPVERLPAGQRRLVLLARAAVKDPALYILDEPCRGLDPAHTRRLLDAVEALARQQAGEAAIICVSHDPLALPRGTSHVLRLDAGRVVANGRENPS